MQEMQKQFSVKLDILDGKRVDDGKRAVQQSQASSDSLSKIEQNL